MRARSLMAFLLPVSIAAACGTAPPPKPANPESELVAPPKSSPSATAASPGNEDDCTLLRKMFGDPKICDPKLDCGCAAGESCCPGKSNEPGRCAPGSC